MNEEKLMPYPTKRWKLYSRQKTGNKTGITTNKPIEKTKRDHRNSPAKKKKFKLLIPTNYRVSQLKKNQIERSRSPIGWSKNAILRMKRRAKLLGIEYDSSITPEYIASLITDKCPALDIKLTYGYGYGKSSSNPSIDRIDNNKGYVVGNLQILSRRANTMKSNATDDELIKFSNWILKIHNV